MIEVKNAKISHTMLGIEDHGVLTYMVSLDYGGVCQGFGGYTFDEPVNENGKFKGRRGVAFGAEAIRRLLDVLDVRQWEKLPGTSVRARCDRKKIYAIGHYLNDSWLSLDDLSKEFGYDS